MNRIALRQSRLELIIGLVILVGIAAYFIPEGLQNHALFNDLGLATISHEDAEYNNLSRQLMSSYEWINVFTMFLPMLPMLAGALFAIPVVMEFEQRTYRLAWTQSITRGRWLVIKLGLALLTTIIFSVLLSVLISWSLAPYESVSGRIFPNFEQHGIVTVAYAVFALAVALAVGTLSKRTAVAVLAAVIVTLFAVFMVGSGLRPHYMAPEEQIVAVGGFQVSYDGQNDIPTSPPPTTTPGEQAEDQLPQGAWEVDRGDYIPASGDSTETTGKEVVYYHPVSRYWAFQGIESVIFLGASAVLLVPVVWVVKRRMR